MAKRTEEAEAKTKVKTGGKRSAARAKVRREAPASAKGKDAAPLSEAARAKKRKETLRNVGITIFAVVIAFAMALPSLSTIFANNRQNAAAEQEAEAAAEEAEADSEDAEGEEGEESEEKSELDQVDDNYTTTIDPLKAKLEENPKDLATLLNLGEDYRAWAYAASAYASESDEAQEHVNELFETAIDYYDQYLELNDSVAVKINRALCVFYSSTTQEGIDAMTALTEEYPESASAWANLGLLYESTYQTDKAQENYKKAAELDADDTEGVKSFANQRIASLNSSKVEQTSDTIESTMPSSTSLSEELLNASKTSI